VSKIIIIAGSNNKNLEVANEFKKNLASKDVESEVLDLVSLNLPLYTPAAELEGIPLDIAKYKKIIDNAQGFIFSIPEYNGGVPPVVTNFIAWISRSGDLNWRESFNGKPAALSSFSGSGGIQALVALRTQLSYIGLNTIGRQVRATYKENLNLEDVNAVSDLLIQGMKS
tara:strand:+ start:107246 stop:107755 length:510 start_codon:yes stop_codon:yes gene_type:complete